MGHTQKRWLVSLISGITLSTMIGASFLVFGHAAASSSPVQTIDDTALQMLTTTLGGVDVLPTTRTIPHWHGTALNPNDGVTYGFNMVGADPNTCFGADCSTTIDTDITPMIVNIDGLTFSGDGAVLKATLDSPLFATNDYGSTPAATSGDPNLPRGSGGVLSQGDAGQQLQLEDATMRAQFNKTGASSIYHLILHPNVLPPVTINVPQNQGALLQSGGGVIFADISLSWWDAQIEHLKTTSDPTHLAVYLTDNVVLHFGNNIFNCCVSGFHGTKAVGSFTGGSSNSNGNAQVQTFAWASWFQPGFFARPNSGTLWAVQDIHVLSHEISEWADNPFDNNTVEPWTSGGPGCSEDLETGDPVEGIGFAMGTNTFEQGPNPNGTQSADGFYHPEDEAFLLWFMRTAPNDVSEPTQSDPTNLNAGRYTLMGDLNRFDDFHQGAPVC